MEFQRLCTPLEWVLMPSNDTHQGFVLAFQRRDALALSTLLIKENQSGPVETLCMDVVVLGSLDQIQDTLLCCAIEVVIRRRDSKRSATNFCFDGPATPDSPGFQNCYSV